ADSAATAAADASAICRVREAQFSAAKQDSWWAALHADEAAAVAGAALFRGDSAVRRSERIGLGMRELRGAGRAVAARGLWGPVPRYFASAAGPTPPQARGGDAEGRKDHMMNKKDFELLIDELGMDWEQARIEKVFQTLDSNGDGIIQGGEWQTAVYSALIKAADVPSQGPVCTADLAEAQEADDTGYQGMLKDDMQTLMERMKGHLGAAIDAASSRSVAGHAVRGFEARPDAETGRPPWPRSGPGSAKKGDLGGPVCTADLAEAQEADDTGYQGMLKDDMQTLMERMKGHLGAAIDAASSRSVAGHAVRGFEARPDAETGRPPWPRSGPGSAKKGDLGGLTPSTTIATSNTTTYCGGPYSRGYSS
ncbi:unnamed protein product, partial [Polarella glacialis]